MSKGGSYSSKKNFATIACVIGDGPLYGLKKIILNGESVWTGPIYRSSSSNPVNLSTKYGTIRLYWGTEDQPADPTLNQYEQHPPYKGTAYVVFVDYDHGQSTNAYNAEFIVLGGAPNQTSITGSAASESLDSGLTVNPVAMAMEILTAEEWLGLDASEINVPSAQLVADALQAETPNGAPTGRSSGAISPLYDSQQDARSVLATIAGISDVWLRVNTAGKIEFGRWAKAPNPNDLNLLGFDDLTEAPTVEPQDPSDTPNSFAIEFSDRDALHKTAKIAVDDLAGIETAGIVRRSNITAKELITYEQALRAGQEALRKAQKHPRWKGSVRRPKAITLAGNLLQPGDLIRVPVSATGSADSFIAIIRIESITYPKDATAAVQIEGTFAPDAVPVLETAYTPPVPEIPDPAVPPINLVRAFSLPAASEGSQPPVHIVACRPESTSAGFKVRYDDTASGDFPVLGTQGSFALPMKLETSVTASSGSLRCSFLPNGSNGERYDRDANFIRNWTGGAVDGRADSLVALIVGLNAGAIVALEACSVSGTPTLVDSDTFDIPVLRSRLRTAAQAWTAGAFTAVEVWIIPHGALINFAHEDFISSAATGLTLYFSVGAYDNLGEYDPAVAWTERQRRQSASVQLGEYAAQPDGSTLYPIHAFVVSSGHYTSKAGFGVLDNDSATVPSAADGSNPVLGPAVTTMQVFVGAKDDSANWAFSATPSSGVTGSLAGRTWTTTGFTADSGYVDITATRSGYANVVSRFVLAKARAGANGAGGAAGLNSATVFLYKRAASTPSKPTTVSTYTFASAILTGHDGGWTQAVPTNDGNPLYVIAATASSTGSTDTIASSEWSTPVVFATNGANGANGTNGTNGTNGANGLNVAIVSLYKRASSTPAVPSVSSTFTFATAALAGHNNGWTQSVPANDGNPLYVTTAAASSAGATDTIDVGDWAAPVIVVVNGTNGTNGTNGANGYSSAPVFIYQRAASSPTLPSVATTYTFATGALTGLNNGWSTSVPANNGNPCWVAVATASSTGATDTIAAAEWATPVILAQNGSNGTNGTNGTNGANGANGLNVASIYLFRRAASSPALPSATCTYTFSSKSLSGQNNGWSTSVPTNDGNKLWVTTATAASLTDSDDIGTGEWAAASIMAENGANGANGTDATAYWLISSAASIAKSSAGAYSPATVTFTGRSQTGAGSPVNYSGRFIIAESSDGTNFGDVYTSSGNEASTTRTPSANIKAIRCRLYAAGGTSTLLDEETVPIVSDGANGTNGTNGTNGIDGTNGATVLGSISANGSAPGYATWQNISAFNLSVSVPAGTRKVTFSGVVVNASGTATTVNARIRVGASTTPAGSSLGTSTAGQINPVTLIGTWQQASPGTVTVTMDGYYGASGGNASVSGNLIVE